MAELEVGGKGERLSHRDVSPCFEHHHGNGTSGEGVTDDELGDDAGGVRLSTWITTENSPLTSGRFAG